MFVEDRMTHPVITVHPETKMQDALNLMHTEHIRRLPVVDKRGKLVGIISERDLLHASPSDVTSLSIWELNYLLSRVTVDRIMTEEVITIDEGTPIEDAALIMADSKVGGLPVVRAGHVVGIITETDLFKVFLELFGARNAGIRLTALVANIPGELTKLTKAIFELDSIIVALGTFLGESTENREITMKVESGDIKALKEAIEPVVERVIDIREMKAV